jgi:integrase/recombinase XerD
VSAAKNRLLEAGVEVNVIREWLGHVDLTTTNRYAQINTKTKTAAASF